MALKLNEARQVEKECRGDLSKWAGYLFNILPIGAGVDIDVCRFEDGSAITVRRFNDGSAIVRASNQEFYVYASVCDNYDDEDMLQEALVIATAFIDRNESENLIFESSDLVTA